MIRAIKYITLILLFSVIAYADQKFEALPNDTIYIALSKNEISRISFDSEVSAINSIKGELEFEVQGKDIFIRTESAKPFNFFVKLENDITYKFIAKVNNIQATQVFVTSIINNDLANQRLTCSDHISEGLKAEITKLIKLTLKPSKHLGHSIIKTNKSLVSDNKKLSLKLIGKLAGDRLVAEKIYITNKSAITQKLNLRDFINNEYLAVYLNQDSILPSESTILVRIMEK